MHRNVRGILTLTSLLGLSAASAGPAKITAQSIIVNPVETKLDVQVWVNRDASGKGNPLYRKGEDLTIGLKTNQDAYVYLFNINANGVVDLFFPNNYEESNFVKAGVTRIFPTKGAKYTFTVGGPNGQDKLLALASTRELDLDDIATFAENQGFAEVRLKGQENLARALSIVVNPLPADGWTTDVATFRVGTEEKGSATGTVSQTPENSTQPVTQPQTQPRETEKEQTPTTQIQAGERRDGTIDRAMAEAYDRLKGDESLGAATTYAVPWGDGWWQKFKGIGAYGDAVLLHANGSSRSYAVHGRLLERYLAMARAENGATRPPSRLGWAAGDEKVIPRNPYGTSGLYGFFQNGALYGTEKYGTFWLQGAVLKTYQGLGGSGSFLGFPTRDQFLLNGGWAADFEGGTIRTIGGVPKIYRK
ncbi:DUF4384 domain-containing protein [Deinococcus deserti]|uniref:Putative S-layer protein n=1 Tax=Deinococcus deserti (strain DSM 17065 / CIP 109153 / LMG 22923 / VCD115) TaxID=546414 RepID=C1D1F8_DEIDV|nr:DUF4384 domain-containing protein [Deinococcus deserti]ACO45682.1 putative S-layer protein [Deinococcus deserti VCD115]